MNVKANSRKRTSVDRPFCKYGSTCYQRKPEHFKKFKHPSEPDNVDDMEVIENFFKGAAVAKSSMKRITKTPEKNKANSLVIPEKKRANSLVISEKKRTNSLVTPEKKRANSLVTPEKNKANSLDIPEKNGANSLDIPCNNDESNKVKNEETVEEILKSMPEDFFDFWEFCSSINKLSPQDAFSNIGYKLVGVYDLLSKKLPKAKKVDISCHWRYYYDPPEFQTVIKKEGKSLFHIGYFRDEPLEKPSILASNSAAFNGKLTLMGDNIFCAMDVELTRKLKSSKDPKISELQQKLQKFASKRNYSLSLQSRKTKQRQKNVVAKTFHGLGIVVPVKNDVGYRPLPDSDEAIKRLLKNIVNAETEKTRLHIEADLDMIICNVNFANDECDYGMGLEFALDLFCFGYPYFHRIILLFLTLAYDLLERPKYGSIVKAHLQNRKQSGDLDTLGI